MTFDSWSDKATLHNIFHLWNQAHPSCQCPIGSVFWGALDSMSISLILVVRNWEAAAGCMDAAADLEAVLSELGGIFKLKQEQRLFLWTVCFCFIGTPLCAPLHIAVTNLIGPHGFGRQKVRPITFQVFTSQTTRWVHEIKPNDLGNVPSGVLGSK